MTHCSKIIPIDTNIRIRLARPCGYHNTSYVYFASNVAGAVMHITVFDEEWFSSIINLIHKNPPNLEILVN